jgi:hypothetical protein
MASTAPATFTNESGVVELQGTLTTSGTSTGDQTITGSLTTTGAVNIGGALNHDGTTVGFYGTAPLAKQAGVAVTAAAIHAALVALGLIAA